jgi:hypothetical protein
MILRAARGGPGGCLSSRRAPPAPGRKSSNGKGLWFAVSLPLRLTIL